jgi:starch synthase
LVAVGDPFAVQVGPRREVGRLWRLPHKRGAPHVYFIDHPDYFDRPGIYGEVDGDYPDNTRRFAFFSRAVIECLPEFGTAPLVIHAHDWHTALAPVYLRTGYVGDAFHDGVACVLSVHNAGFQGHFQFDSLADVGLPDSLYNWQQLEWYGKVNWLKGGLTFSEMTVTVSPTHAHELRTASGGFGLHDTFIGLKSRLVGIINGIDTTVWNPEDDPEIAAGYTEHDLAGKVECKAALQRELNLPVNPRIPIFGMTARLVAQKGLDLILEGKALASLDAQFVFLGEGEARYETALRQLAHAMPDRVAVETNFNEQMEHRLIAGSDMLLMPSLYEPCGLTQMRAQHYGAIPVARRVGGLADTIQDGVTGFLFDDYSPQDLDVAAGRAVAHYTDQAAWGDHMRRAMRQDFGWERPAAGYAEVYQQALALRTAGK